MSEAMNYSTAIFLMSEEVRCVMVAYEPDNDKMNFKAKRVPYKTFDKDIKVGDLVVVPTTTRWNMTVCKVVAVDVDPDLDTQEQIKWIVGVVDSADFEQIKAKEDEAISALKKARFERKKRELRETLIGSEETLKKLPTVNP